MHLTPGTRLDWHDSHTLTLHLHGKPSLRFEQLTPAESDWLRALSGPNRASNAPQRQPAGISYLRKRLIAAGYARIQEPRDDSHDRYPHLPAETQDLHARGLDAYKTLRQRECATVLICGLNRLSFAVIKELVRSGITQFIIEPGPLPAPIESLIGLHEDLAEVGLKLPNVPTSKELRTAATRYLAALSDKTVVVPDTNKPSVALIALPVHSPASHHALSLVQAQLIGNALPHLLVQFDGVASRIGPFTIPDLSDTCYDLPDEPPTQLGSCTAIITRLSASVAAGQLIRFMEGYIPATAHGRIEFDIHSLIPRHTPLTEHDNCLCPHKKTLSA